MNRFSIAYTYIYILPALCLSLAMDVSANAYGPPISNDNEVVIHYSGVEVPLNRIVLVRKSAQYCAIIFTRCWAEIDEERTGKCAPNINMKGDVANDNKEAALKKYSIYQSFYQDDGTGNFTNKNVKIFQGTASWLPLRGPFRPFIYQPGDAYVKCGPNKFVWQYKTFIGVITTGKFMGDYGFEIAPTPWTDIGEVNIHDPRIKWYRYDEKRERIYIPIDKLWATPVSK